MSNPKSRKENGRKGISQRMPKETISEYGYGLVDTSNELARILKDMEDSFDESKSEPEVEKEIKSVQKIQQQLSTILTRLEKLEQSLHKQHNNIKENQQQQQRIQEQQNVLQQQQQEAIQQQQQDIHKQQVVQEQIQPFSDNQDKVQRQLQFLGNKLNTLERKERATNLRLIGIEESEGEDCNNLVCSILHTDFNMDAPVTNARRVGRRSERARHIVFSLKFRILSKQREVLKDKPYF